MLHFQHVLNYYSGFMALAALLLAALGLLTALGASGRAARQSRTLRQMMSGPEGADLEALLKRVTVQSDAAARRGEELETRLQSVSDEMLGCVSRLGFVRFDAYPDVSGQQSFSLALLDGRGHGAILTSLFGRTDARCFGKSVSGGTADAPLSEEESEALRMAMAGERYHVGELANANGETGGRGRGRSRR